MMSSFVKCRDAVALRSRIHRARFGQSAQVVCHLQQHRLDVQQDDEMAAYLADAGNEFAAYPGAEIGRCRYRAGIRPDTRLFERSAGELTGLTWEEAGRQWPEMKKGKAAAVFQQAAAAYPRGESLELVYRRAAEALDEAIATEQRVVVISHELTLKALLAHLMAGKLDDAAFALQVENGRPISLVRHNGRWERLGQ
jgi:broad specificity phosphatase PhoE